MKGGQIFAQLTPTTNKYIPTPEAATIILNFFIYNNFQDFNTWQQIARTKIEYDYYENSKAAHVCKVALKWDDRTLPTFIESAEAKTKKSAKKRALRRLIESIIHQGYIGLGFKEDNFVEKLPRRRKNDSDESEDEISEQKYPQRATFLSLLKQGQYQPVFGIISSNDMKWKGKELMEGWRYGLSIKSSQFLRKVIQAYRGQEVSFQLVIETDKFKVSPETIVAPRQFSYGKQVNDPLREELTDFMRYQQLQKTFVSTNQPLRQPDINIYPIPSEHVLKEMKTPTPSRQQLTSFFHPIEGRKIFLSSLQRRRQERNHQMTVQLPRFEREERELTLKMTQQMYGMLPYYCLDYQFVEEVIKMMKEEIKSVDIVFDASVDQKYQEKGVDYYLNFKNLLTAEFCHLLHGKFLSSWNNVCIQGMVVPFRHEDQVFIFNCKQPEQILNKKMNRRANYNEFDEMHEISVNEIVALVSKIEKQVVYLAQIVELSPLIKLIVPNLSEDSNDPQPFTMVRVYNSKIFEKTSSSIIKVAKTCMKLLDENTTILWQPPSFPTLSVLSELLVEWQTIKSTVLIVSLDSETLHNQLTNFGFKVVKITQRTQQRMLTKCSIVIASPSAVCCELLKNYAFSRVLIQSAHHLSEISCLSALSKGCQELYLIGDPFMPRMQIGSPYSQLHGMGVSLLQRLYNNGAKTQTYVSRLENCCEFRNVMEWADRFVYNGKLMLFGNEVQTPIIKGFPWPSIDFRVCFLHHPNTFDNEVDYLEQQAYICSAICGQVAKSGYTKLEEITCSAATRKCIPFLQKYMGILLKMLNFAQAKLFKKYMSILCRVVSGSIYFRSDLSIIMLGNQREEIGFREIVGAMREGRRGVIFIGDLHYFYQNPDFSNFLDWCKQKKLINRVETQLMTPLS